MRTLLFGTLRTSLITSIDQGANPLAVAQRMGHTDPAVTLRVYGHLFAGAQEELTERLDNLRRGSNQRAANGKVVELLPCKPLWEALTAVA